MTLSPERLADVQADFRNFLFLMWQHLGLPEPTPVQYDIAHYLQHGPRRRMVQAFRGVGKSWITAAFVIWRLFRNPNERILVVSASKDRSDAFSIFVKRVIAEWDLLAHLRPRPGQRDSNVAFDVGPSDAHQAPSVRSVGIKGQLTGGRATLIVPDDIEVPNNSLTQLMRDQLSEAVKEFDAVLSPGGEIVYLGTPQTEMSVYNDLPSRGYDVRIWPSRYAPAEQYNGALAPMLAEELERNPGLVMAFGTLGAPTDPKRFSHMDLLEREASYGRSGYQLQFQLNTRASDSDKHPLKTGDLLVLDLDKRVAPVKLVWGSAPQQEIRDLQSVGLTGDRYYRPMYVSEQFADYQGKVMFIDPSGQGADETAYAIVAHLHGYLFLLEVGGFRDGFGDGTMGALANAAKRWGVGFIRIEPNYGGGMFDKLLAPWLQQVGHPCTIDPDPPRSAVSKEKRICDTLEPVMNQHRLVVNAQVIRDDLQVPLALADKGLAPEKARSYSLFYQLTRITRDKGALRHDDRVDAVAGAVSYFTDLLDKDQRKLEEEHRARLMQQWVNNTLATTGQGGGRITMLNFGSTAAPSGNWMNLGDPMG